MHKENMDFIVNIYLSVSVLLFFLPLTDYCFFQGVNNVTLFINYVRQIE